MARASRAGCVYLSAAAVAGVVAAHTVADVLVLPDPHARAEHLQATGHGYWPVAVYLAVALGALALAWTVARGAGTLRTAGPEVARFRLLATRQLLVFAVVEASERLVAGVPVTDLWREPAFVVGLAVQVVVAAGLALLLRRAEGLGARVAAAMRPSGAAARPRPRWSPASCGSPPRQPLLGPARSRAPPIAAAP
jgi:hypothetical protein